MDGPETACLPRRASDEADSPLVRVAAPAGGLDREIRCRGCRCVAPVTPAWGRGRSPSRLRAAAYSETREPTSSVVETSLLEPSSLRLDDRAEGKLVACRALPAMHRAQSRPSRSVRLNAADRRAVRC